MSDPEFDLVERPLVEQLEGLGWGHLAGDKWNPAVTERTSFREIVLEGRLRAALRRINVNDQSEEWLDESRISQAVSALTKIGGTSKLIEANQDGTRLLLTGTVVPGVEGWDQGKSRTVHYIDWDQPTNNDFLVINQFRVDEPGWSGEDVHRAGRSAVRQWHPARSHRVQGARSGGRDGPGDQPASPLCEPAARR